MSESTPSRMQGQIEAPNPIELFWEKNRRVVITVVVAVLFGVALNYVLQYMEQRKIDAQWGDFAQSSGLETQYVAPEVLPIGPASFPAMVDGLVTKMDKHVGEVDPATLSAALAESAGTPAEPWLLWAAAHRAMEHRAWSEAEGYLNDLQSRFPEHPLCVTSEHPVQYQKPVEKDPPDPPDSTDEPELEPAIPGSAVGFALKEIQKQQAFSSEQPRFYEPIDPPEGSPRVRVNTSLGPFVIALYRDRALEHVDTFLRLVGEDFYDGQNVDRIMRAGSGPSFGPTPEAFHFGLESSKNEDRTLWVSTGEDKEVLEFEDSPGQRELSHFPGTLSATPAADGKSYGDRYWINVNDCGGLWDGERVIVGRVVEGQDVLELIAGTPFATDLEVQAGQGKPRENIRIESIEVL